MAPCQVGLSKGEKMSHYTTHKTKIKNFDMLREVLKKLGMDMLTGVRARSYYSDKEAEAIIRFTNYDVGISKDALGNYGLGADWDMISGDMAFRQTVGNVEAKRKLGGLTEVEKFQNMITQSYNEAVIRDVAFSEGLIESSETVEEDGTVVLEYLE